MQQPTPLLDQPTPPLSRLRENFKRIEKDYDLKRAELEAATEKARNDQRTLSGLQRGIDDAADQLVRADEHNAQLKAAAQSIRAGMLTAWGLGHVDGSSYRPPDYSALVGINSAIADYPRVRVFLQERLAVAQTALRNFERANKF